MRRKMRPEQFPPQYFDIAEKVGGENQVIHIPIQTLNEAHKLRGHFYLFKGIVRDHADAAIEKMPEARTPTDLQHIRLREWLDKVSFWVDKETISAKFINRDQSFYGQLLAKATMTPGPELGKSFKEKELDDWGAEMAKKYAAAPPPHSPIPPNPMNSYVPPKEPKE